MIIRAALLVQVEGLNEPTILPCRRRGDGYSILKDLGYAPKTKYKVEKEGFINHKGQFLDRYDAFKHALDCGQLSQSNIWYKKDNHEVELYSEDLY